MKMASNDDQDNILLLALCQKVLSLGQAKAILRQENDLLLLENNRLQTDIIQRDQRYQELEKSKSHHQVAQGELKAQLEELWAEIERLKSIIDAQGNMAQGNQPDLECLTTNAYEVHLKRPLSDGDEPLNVAPSPVGDRAVSHAGISKTTVACQNRQRRFKQGILQRSAYRKHQLQRQLLSTPSSDDNRPPTQLTNADTTLPDSLGSQWSLNGSFPDLSRYPVLPQAYVDGYNKCLVDMEMTMLKTRVFLQDSTIAQLQNVLQAVNDRLIGIPGAMQLPVMQMVQPSMTESQLQLQKQQILAPFNVQLQQLQQQSIVYAQGQSVKNTPPSRCMMTSHPAASYGVADVCRTQSMANDHSYTPAMMVTMQQPDSSVDFAGMPAVARVTSNSILTHSLPPLEDSLYSDEVNSNKC